MCVCVRVWVRVRVRVSVRARVRVRVHVRVCENVYIQRNLYTIFIIPAFALAVVTQLKVFILAILVTSKRMLFIPDAKECASMRFRCSFIPSALRKLFNILVLKKGQWVCEDSLLLV